MRRRCANSNHNSNVPKFNKLFSGPKSSYSSNFIKSTCNLLSFVLANKQTNKLQSKQNTCQKRRR